MDSDSEDALPLRAFATTDKSQAEKKSSGGKWIQKATANSHGQFRAKAEKAGMSTHSYAEAKKYSSGKTGKQARLALALMSVHNHG